VPLTCKDMARSALPVSETCSTSNTLHMPTPFEGDALRSVRSVTEHMEGVSAVIEN
jgi:hypothetical protein